MSSLARQDRDHRLSTFAMEQYLRKDTRWHIIDPATSDDPWLGVSVVSFCHRHMPCVDGRQPSPNIKVSQHTTIRNGVHARTARLHDVAKLGPDDSIASYRTTSWPAFLLSSGTSPQTGSDIVKLVIPWQIFRDPAVHEARCLQVNSRDPRHMMDFLDMLADAPQDMAHGDEEVWSDAVLTRHHDDSLLDTVDLVRARWALEFLRVGGPQNSEDWQLCESVELGKCC